MAIPTSFCPAQPRPSYLAQDFLSSSYVPGTVLDAPDTAVGRSVKVLTLEKPDEVKRQLQQIVTDCDKYKEESKADTMMNYRPERDPVPRRGRHRRKAYLR